MIFGRRRAKPAPTAGVGAVVVTGNSSAPITTNVHVAALDPQWTARSVYLEQVRRIAPPRLLERQAELAELAAFCTEPNRGPYVWWRADAWAGKSALLSTFVLYPPAELAATGVQIVSFFVTARQAGQDTREAFTTSVLGQLCTLTGRPMPTMTDDGTREAWMLALLRDAAAAQQRAGGRLVLVVDGLDEERGVSLGPNISSIAGLLPNDPPHGMRVIVAGRPNPPLPADVPSSHPLCDRRAVRHLNTSRHARDMEQRSQAELRRILTGSDVEQDLLGLLTASRGGLSQSDLRELTGADRVTIEDVLHTVAGRTFTRRAGAWSAGSAEVYLLGHEELQRTATKYLGEERLVVYRERLNAWADNYRSRERTAWPSDTPEYLLREYPWMLAEVGDAERLVALVTDTARQDRMLDLSGGDTSALVEIRAAQDLIVNEADPDLVFLAHLARHRDDLEARNAAIPANLPVLWATLGHWTRAESLARSIPDLYRQVQALAQLTRVQEVMSDQRNAAAWAAAAAQVAVTIGDPRQRAQAFAEVVGAMLAAGDRTAADNWAEAARQIVENIPTVASEDFARSAIAKALAIAGAPTQAKLIATNMQSGTLRTETLDALTHIRTATSGTVPSDTSRTGKNTVAVAAGEPGRSDQVALAMRVPGERAQALAGIALATAAAGDVEQARVLATLAESSARTVPNHRSPRELMVISRVVAIAGDTDRAERIANGLINPDQRIEALSEIAVAAARHTDRAQRIAEMIPAAYQRALTLAAVAESVANSGDPTRAASLAFTAERVARTVPAPSQQARALTAAAQAAAAAGDFEHVEAIVRGIPDSADRVNALVEVARTHGGDHSRDLSLMAEVASRTVTAQHRRIKCMALVAVALVEAGDQSRGLKLAVKAADTLELSELGRRVALARAETAQAVAVAGDVDRALRLADTAPNPYDRLSLRADIACRLAAAGNIDSVAQIVDSFNGLPESVEWKLGKIPRLVAEAGDSARAEHFASRLKLDSDGRVRTLVDIALAGATPDVERARRLALAIRNPNLQAQTLTAIACLTGLPAGRHLFARALVLGSWLTPLPALAELQPDLVLRITEGYGDESLPAG